MLSLHFLEHFNSCTDSLKILVLEKRVILLKASYHEMENVIN